MAEIWVFNDSGSSSTYQGQVIADQAYHQIEEHKRVAWSLDSDLLADMVTGDAVVSRGNSSGDHITDFGLALNFLRKEAPQDSDGAPLSRNKITQTGWHYQLHGMEVITSKLNGAHNSDYLDADLGFLTVKHYKDVSGTDTLMSSPTQAQLDSDCIRTDMIWEADYDFEIVGGSIYQASAPSSDIRFYAIGVPDLTKAQGGSVDFCVGGVNLKLIGSTSAQFDGKTSKKMPYDATYHTNKFQFIFRHDAGVQHPVQVVFNIYRENA
jgi:hypothetical protein